MTVKIQGTIVSPDYDDDFFASWINKGVITPSSRVVAAIETADEPIDLYINSYGGDVFAGGEMMIALLKAQAAGKLRTVEVGSLAASMAANIVAALKVNGAKITAHANTQLLFHGCYTTTEGGAQHHEDVADSLRNINDSIIANLNRIGITDCRAWFAEGREKWLDADEALALGIVDEVADTSALAPMQKETASRLAAFARTINSRKEYEMRIDDETMPKEDAAPVAEAAEAETPVEAPAEAAETTEAEAPADESAPVEAAPAPVEEQKPEEVDPEDSIEERVKALANERFASLQAKHDKLISDLTKERDTARADLATAQAEATSLRADIDKLNADLAQVRDQLAESERNREAVVASALTPTQPKPADGKSARQTLAALPPSKRAEYYKAHKAEIDGTN